MEGKGQIVSVLDRVLELLEADGLVRRFVHIHPKQVGVHPSNRYGYGVSAATCHSLGAKIIAMGFSWAACALALCIADGSGRKIAKFTCEMQNKSTKFGRSSQAEIQYGSLSCGHTNQFLVACLDGVETDEESLAINGRISTDKITAGVHGPKMNEALAKGLKWTVVDSRVEDMYPKFPNLAQRARQAVGQAQDVESVLQQCKAIQEYIAEGMPWKAVAEMVRQSQPVNPHDIGKICEFVELYAGHKLKGENYLNKVIEFHACCCPPSRGLTADFLHEYTSLKLESHEMCPDFVCSSIMAHLDSPLSAVKNNISYFVKESMVKALATTKKAEMMEANQHIRTFARALEDIMELDNRTHVKYDGMARTTAARIVHGLPVKAVYQDCSIPQVFNLIFEDLKKELHMENLVNPFDDAFEEADPQARASADAEAVASCVAFDGAGRPIGMDQSILESQGFVAGASVESINTGDLATILIAHKIAHKIAPYLPSLR